MKCVLCTNEETLRQQLDIDDVKVVEHP